MTYPTRRSLRPIRSVTSVTWWVDAGQRAARTALAALLPLVALLVAGDVDPVYVLGVTGLAVIGSLATSLAGLPEDDGRVVAPWLAVLTRVLKTAGQMLAAATAGIVLFQDVPWGDVGTAVAGASLTTLILALITYLPETEATVRVPADALTDPALRDLAATIAAIEPTDPAVAALGRLGVRDPATGAGDPA